MKKRNKRIVLGTGIVSLVTCAFLAVRYRAYIQAWKNGQIESAYYKSRTETDIAWG